jgi:hypothetical protein
LCPNCKEFGEILSEILGHEQTNSYIFIYIDVTPVARKGTDMIFFLEQQRHLLDVKAQHAFLNTTPSIGRKGITCFSLKNSAIYWT